MSGIFTVFLPLHHFRFEMHKSPVLSLWWTNFTSHDQLALWSINHRKSLPAYKRTNMVTLTLFRNTFPRPQIQPQFFRYALNHPLTCIIFWVFLLVSLCVDVCKLVSKYRMFISTWISLASLSSPSDGWRRKLWRTQSRVSHVNAWFPAVKRTT